MYSRGGGGAPFRRDKATEKKAPRVSRAEVAALAPPVDAEKEIAVETNTATVAKRGKRKRAVDEPFEPSEKDLERAEKEDSGDLMVPKDDDDKKEDPDKVYEGSEEVADFLEGSNLPKEIIDRLVNADPRLQVYLGLREKTPGGLKRTDLMEPIVKSIDLSNAAMLQAYKDNGSGKGKNSTYSRMCKKFKNKDYYIQKGEIIQDVRTTKPFNREGTKEAPEIDKSEKKEVVKPGVRRSGRARNIILTPKQLEIAAAANALTDEQKEYYGITSVNTANYQGRFRGATLKKPKGSRKKKPEAEAEATPPENQAE
jgi:hypothetical protein